MLRSSAKLMPCKGTGKAKGKGCGSDSDKRHLGLCPSCYFDYLKETNQLNPFLASAKRKAEKERNKETREKKESIKRKGEYEQELQTEINTMVRLIDHDKGCISCDHGWENPWSRQKHAGHRFSVGGHGELRYHLFNIFCECSICNNYLSGNPDGYDKGLVEHYGQETLEMVHNLRLKYKELHLSIPELKESIKTAREIIRKILKGETYTREQVNNELKIYR